MKVIVFDLGGTLMEYCGMPECWTDYYVRGFKAINQKYACGASEEDIQKSVEVLRSFNPRINYREIEYSPEFIFSKTLEHWPKDIPFSQCAYTFYEGLSLEPRIYPDVISALKELKQKGYGTAALTDLPTAMPDDLFKKDIPELLDYLDLYVSSMSCGYRKPNCEGLKQIAGHFHVPVTELIFVGDEEKDRRTAENAGCRFVQVNRKESGN